MRDYIDQFYNEGLATTFYLRPIKYIEKKFKNKKMANVFGLIIKMIYTILVLVFAVLMFISKFPL